MTAWYEKREWNIFSIAQSFFVITSLSLAHKNTMQGMQDKQKENISK